MFVTYNYTVTREVVGIAAASTATSARLCSARFNDQVNYFYIHNAFSLYNGNNTLISAVCYFLEYFRCLCAELLSTCRYAASLSVSIQVCKQFFLSAGNNSRYSGLEIIFENVSMRRAV